MKAFAVALLLVASTAGAQSTIDPSGHWKGTIEIPNNPTALSLRISGRTSSRMAVFSRSASHRSGVIHG